MYIPYLYQNIPRTNHLQEMLINKETNAVDTSISLNKVLEEDNLINEFKSNKEYILNYFNLEKLDSLLQFMFGNNLDTELSSNKTKYPYIASEIFSHDNELIINYFFNILKLKTKVEEHNTDELYKVNRINYLFDFIKENEELNYTVAGYLSNIINNLINKKPELIIKMVLDDDLLIKSIIKHNYSLSISVILGNIINFNKYFLLKNINLTDEENNTEINNLQKKNLIFIKEIINIYLQTLDDYEELERNKNLFEIIFENLKEFKNQNFNIEDSYHYSEENIEDILNKLFDKEVKNKLGLIKIISLMIETVNIFKKGNGDIKNKLNEKFIQKVKEYEFNPNLKNGRVVILTNGSVQKLNNKTVFCELFLLNKIIFYNKIIDSEFDNVLIKMNLIPKLIEIFKNFPWNNIIHQITNKIFFEILIKNSMIPNTIKDIFKNDELIDFFNESKDIFNENKKDNKIGYMGYVKKLYEHIIDFIKTSEIDLNLDIENNNKWINFKKEYYDKQNELEEFCLGNLKIEESIDESFEFTVDDIKKKFCDFLNIKYDENGLEIQIEKTVDTENMEDKESKTIKIDSTGFWDNKIPNLEQDQNNNADQSFNSYNYWKNDSNLILDPETILKNNGLI